MTLASRNARSIRVAFAAAVFIVFTPLSSFATQLGQLAQSMAPGTWAELNTTGLDALIPLVDSEGITRSLFEFSDDGVWYPTNEQFLFIGGGHRAPKRFIAYSAAANAWTQLPNPPWFPSTTMHGYDHNAIDVSRNALFHYPFGIGNRTVRRYDLQQQTWDTLPQLPSGVAGYVNCCRGVEYFPELDALVVVTSGEVYLFSFATNQWSLLATSLSMGSYENFAEYNPVDGIVLFGGGLGNRNIYRLDATGTITPLNNAPTPLGITFAVITVDPVSGDYLVLADSLRLYAYDALRDVWRVLDDNPPLPTEEGNAYDVIAAPISTFGVTMFVTSYNFNEQGSVWLYKHAQATPDMEPPQIMLTAPANGAILLGTVTVSADATDNVSVAGVQFLLDGADLEQEDTVPPYSIAWDTLTAANGIYNLTARARDSAGNTAESTPVVVTVDNRPNNPPLAVDDAVNVDEDGSIVIDVLINDSDPDGDELTVGSITLAANGTVTLNSGDTVTYEPDPNFNGMDIFTYDVVDGFGGTATANVLITVDPVNDAPAPNDQAVATPQDTAVNIMLTASDIDNDPLTFRIVDLPGFGTLSPVNGQQVTYTPNPGAFGTDTFTFVANDGTVDSNLATVFVTVNQAGAMVQLEPIVVVNVGNAGWTLVNLQNAYVSPVVVCSPNYDNTVAPLVVRMRNAGANSFEIRVQRADPSADPVTGITVHCFAVEEGVYTEAENGVTLEAVTYVSTVTDRRGSWQGEVRTYANAYTNPAVVGQVMTFNDPAFSTFWARGASRTAPPNTVNLRTGKHVAEDLVRTRANETIGYVVIEAGSGTVNNVAYLAALGSDSIRGMGNAPPYTYNIAGPPTVTAAIVSSAAMDGGNGGWPALYGANPVSPTSLALAYDEDQLRDAERNHTTEQVAYIVLGQ